MSTRQQSRPLSIMRRAQKVKPLPEVQRFVIVAVRAREVIIDDVGRSRPFQLFDGVVGFADESVALRHDGLYDVSVGVGDSEEEGHVGVLDDVLGSSERRGGGSRCRLLLLLL